MTTAARQAEADQASIAFQAALTQLGAGTVEEALLLWKAVPATARVTTSTTWLRRAITLVMTRRRMSRDLARAYYRLVRALRTGSTVADPHHPEPRYVTLDVLRREFAELAGGAASGPPALGTPEPGAGVRSVASSTPPVVDEAGQPSRPPAPSDRVRVEELPALSEGEERIEREAEAEARTVLEALGPANLERKTSQLDEGRPAREVDQAREEAHRQAGARQAAAAERLVNNGARSLVWHHAGRDRRVVGYIRLSRSGTPCGWCAMLISRGPVYRSRASAEYGDGDKYHDNCHCTAEPIYSREQYGGSPLYDLNRRYEVLWPKVTRGLTGKAAVSAWRRHIRQEQKAAALEARRAPTNVQEA
ncbi:hypothetical protein [Streptomyces sp. NPDC047097]|uniref:VG15 protein n=1 Tax=Streptomyces sp. NPDC047097 TaxID=3155260 RepID=UPI0033D876D8